jgi:hypothetical protein
MNLEASCLTKRLLYQYISSYALTLSYRPLKACELGISTPSQIVTKAQGSQSASSLTRLVPRSRVSHLCLHLRQNKIFVLILYYLQRILSSKYFFLDNWAKIKRSFGLVSRCPNPFEARHRVQQPWTPTIQRRDSLQLSFTQPLQHGADKKSWPLFLASLLLDIMS